MYCNNGEAQVIPPYIVARPPVCAVLQWLFGGYSSLFNQPVASSVFMGSGFSHSKHRNFPCPLPPGATLGSRSPASGASRSFGLAQFFRHSRRPSIQKQASVVCNIQLNWQGTVCVLVDCAIVPVRNIGTGKPKTVSARSPYARAASLG